jgi:NADPH:quinone reductase-like Zn-dependent oxidoreductase
MSKQVLFLGAMMGLATLSQAATPGQQQAIVQSGRGGPDVLSLKTVPVLEPAADQVLIRVYAAAVNPVDWKMRGGSAPGAAPAEAGPPGGGAGGPPPGGAGGPPPGGGAGGPPGGGSPGSIPGFDVAGVVEKVGPGVTAYKAGDPVFSMIGRVQVNGLNGGYSQFVIAPVANVVAKPKNFTYAQAAGLGTAGMTGERIVREGGVKKGQKVLITGVAGGVGSTAAQVAKAEGAYVVGTASEKHAAYLKSIGVDKVIDYTKGNFEEQVKDVDVVINTVSGDTAERSLKTLKKGGTFVSVASRPTDKQCADAAVTCGGTGPGGMGGGMTEGSLLAAAGKLAGEGKYRINVDKTFPLEQAGAAQEYNREGHSEGKVILIVDAANANRK